ncbi:hypothetical protein PCASD_02744 [Puccinia coronata f. sp. avenae]|uniref:Prefoldin subunit 4 n=1 Tax=Puccinia coronata f. sp. avenae TaxID=200324 RepID=A0A2N5VH75_9BASI|nr:hypothetical protein PCASD_02744 [Puccinia coronata f. sp. avenae]
MFQPPRTILRGRPWSRIMNPAQGSGEDEERTRDRRKYSGRLKYLRMQMLEPDTKSGQEIGEEIEVNLQDQKMINEFSNLNLKRMKLKKALKSKSLELDDLVELENELLLSSFDVETNDNNDQKTQSGTEDNDLILYKLDTSYIHIKRSTFQETKLTEKLERSKEAISKLNSEMDELSKQMSVLKKALYSKFGNTINLEGGDDDDDDDDAPI